MRWNCVSSCSRRMLLASVATATGAGLGGCIGVFDATETPFPDELAFGVRVTRQATAEHPARLTVSVENTGDRSWTYPVWPPDVDGEHRVPFDDFTASREGGGGRLSLLPDHGEYIGPVPGSDSSIVPEESTGGCWETSADDVVTADIAPQAATLAPGTAFTEDYTLVDGPGDGCRPAGDYLFSTTKRVTVEEAVYDVELSFTLRIAADRTVSAVVDPPAVEPRTPA